MTGITSGPGAPTSYVGQAFPGTSPSGGYAFASHPFGLQPQQWIHPLQQQQQLQQLLQIVPQQLQQLLHIVPQQLQNLQHVQQQVYHLQQHLQQLLQIVPQQLHQLQQLVQNLPQQLLQQPFHAAPQPFGTIHSPTLAGFGAAPSQPVASPWALSTVGQGVGYPQATGSLPHPFGYGAQPSHFM
jgi:hypothetical protein